MAKDRKKKLRLQPLIAKSDHSQSKAKKVPPVEKRERPTIPIEADDRILLIGEGDFSFAKSIVESHGCYNVTATCLDSQAELFHKYDPHAEQNVQYLQGEGQVVMCDIDATKMGQNKKLKDLEGFDRILFNFPHVGGKSKDVNRQVRFNQELLVKFFRAAEALLAPQGTIIVTLFEGEPYTLWNIRDLARHSGLEVQRSFKFLAEAYPGYSHARTLGYIEGGGGWKGEDRSARTYVFQRKGARATSSLRDANASMGKKRKRGAETDSDEEQ